MLQLALPHSPATSIKLTQNEGGFVAKIFGAAKQPPPLHHSTLRVTEYLSLDLLLQLR